MRHSASSSSFPGFPRKAGLLLATCLAAAALPAWPEAPRCDAQTCPPLQLRLEEGFQISSQRLEQGMPAAVPAPDSTAPGQATQPLPPQLAAEATSPWLIAAFALVAGMLLQGLIQGLLRRRRAAVPGVVAPTPAPMQVSARATGLALELPAAEPAATLSPEPLAVFADVADEPAEPVTAAETLPEPPPAESPVIAEAQSELLEEPQDPVMVELELPPNLAIAETPAALAEAAEPEVPVVAFEALPEPEFPEAGLFAPVEPEVAELSGEATAAIDPPLEAVEAPLEPTEEPQDPVVVFELEPLPTPASAEPPAVSAELAGEPSEPVTAAEIPPEPVFFIEPFPDELPAVAEVPQDPVVFELESLVTSFTADPPEVIAAGEPPPEPEFPEAAPVATVESGIQDLSGEVPAEIDFELDFPLEPEAVEGAAELPEPAPAAASDTHRLETVALLKRMSAQRARGLHPEARLASVFRRISSGRLEAADKSLRELEAFCSDSEEAFPPELLTTRQHIVRGRDYELANRIDSLRARARDEASGRRLAVAGVFLRRGRFDAVAEVLDELESDLSREVEVL